MSMKTAAAVAVLALAGLVAAGCKGGFPKCGSFDCAPCLDCDQLIGTYDGTMTDFKNDCVDSPLNLTEPWSISFSEIVYDEADDSTYLEFDMTAGGYGIVNGTLCAPVEKDGEQHYGFCMDFPFESMVSGQQNWQTTKGAFIEGADGAIRFEGKVHNLMHDPMNGECHIRATASATQQLVE